MKFLLDENVGKLVAEFLRKKGYDVKSAIEEFRGYPDEKILKIASKENRILVTLDQDFGRMICQSKPPHKGVILLRLKNESNLIGYSNLQIGIWKLGFGIFNFGE